jgi:hypothetical protein
MENTNVKSEEKESLATQASEKGSCTEAPAGATEQNPAQQGTIETPLNGEEHSSSCIHTTESLEGLTEVGTLSLQVIKKNRCGTATKWARKAKSAEAPTGATDGGRPQSAAGKHPLDSQEPGTLGDPPGWGPAASAQKSPESRGHPHGPGKRQRLAEGTPEGGQAKRPKQTGQISYARVAQEGLWVATVSKEYPREQTSRDNFVDIQRVIGRLVDELPQEGFTPRLVDSYWSKGAAITVCHDESTKEWLAAKAPSMVAWEGSRLKVVGLDALPTYKRVVAWFLDPVEATEWYLLWLRRLNRGMDTGNWRVYEHKEEPNGVHLVLSINTASITMLEGLRWRPFSGVGEATFTLLGAKQEGKK